jgi:hypothetical protein
MNYPAASGRSIKRPAAQNKFAISGGELNPKMIKRNQDFGVIGIKMNRKKVNIGNFGLYSVSLINEGDPNGELLSEKHFKTIDINLR